MKLLQFKKLGWFYYPTSVMGFVIAVFIGAVFIHDLLFVNSRAHSVSDLYYNFIPYGFIYIATYLWIGKNASAQ